MNILVVDDDPIALQLIAAELAEKGHDCELAADGTEAMEQMSASGQSFDLVLSDYVMPGLDGMQLLAAIRERSPDLPFILMTAIERRPEAAIRAEELGADDYLLKPLKPGEATFAVERAAKQRELRERLEVLDEAVRERYGFGNLVGRNHRMQQIYDAIQLLSETDATVLVTGETGTGKELVARAIHFNSARRDRHFLTINCGALPETLLESELFGHERGAFTGAVGRKIGKFQYGDGGTVFLDEIGEIPPAVQVKILRVLQNREFERVGGNETVQVDVRVLAATNVDLHRAIREGTFREDLFYRLNVVPLHIPPLRERKEDIPLLVEHFLVRLRERLKKRVHRISDEAMRQLMAHDWPGNVRELENVVERAFIMARGELLRSVDLRGPTDAAPPETALPAMPIPEGPSLPEAVQAFETEYLRAALTRERGHVGRTARSCGITERTLHRKMKRYNLDKSNFSRKTK